MSFILNIAEGLGLGIGFILGSVVMIIVSCHPMKKKEEKPKPKKKINSRLWIDYKTSNKLRKLIKENKEK